MTLGSSLDRQESEREKRIPPDHDPAYDLKRVLSLELDAIRQGRARRGNPPPTPGDSEDNPIAGAHAAQLTGLALSGTGVRSAVFHLGILQGLARLGLLRRFDYLSSSAGGGYIAGWLEAWIRREGLAKVEADLAQDAAAHGVGQELNEDEEGSWVEPAPVRHLRALGSHVTRRPGLFSADAWTMAVVYLWNLVLNLVVVILGVGVLLLLPRVVLLVSRTFDRSSSLTLLQVAALFLGIVMFFIGANLSETFAERDTRWSWFSGAGWVQRLIVVPLCLAA